MACPIVQASFNFLQRNELYQKEKPYSIQFYPHGDIPQTNFRSCVVPAVPVHDMRAIASSLNFDRDGFVVRHIITGLTKEEFSVPEKVIDVYAEEVKNVLSDLFGTRNVTIVEYLVRRRHTSFPLSTGDDFEYAQPVSSAHVDFSPDCLVEMIRDRYAHRADSLLGHRYRIINIWKPLRGPLRDWPLALCRPSSLDPHRDLQLVDRVYPMNVEESIQIHYSESQEWYYLSDQKETEALIFRGGDSSVGLNAGVPHCSFNLTNATEQQIPRESIEMRALVFDADEDLDLASVALSRRHGPKATYLQQSRHD